MSDQLHPNKYNSTLITLLYFTETSLRNSPILVFGQSAKPVCLSSIGFYCVIATKELLY